jgi:hypothetical protein
MGNTLQLNTPQLNTDFSTQQSPAESTSEKITMQKEAAP